MRRITADELDNLIKLARAGGAESFDGIYRHLAPSVHGYLRARGASEAEDLTSEVFTDVFEQLTSFTGTHKDFRAWVFTIAHHKLVDDIRDGNRRPIPTDDLDLLDHPASDAVREAEHRLGEQWVYDVTTVLTPLQREVVLLRMIADLSGPQIAQVLDKSPDAVKQLSRRAYRSLWRQTEREGTTP